MPADMSNYPPDWPEIRKRILLRAGGHEDDPRVGARCEFCGVRNYSVKIGDEGATDDFDAYQDARNIANSHNRSAAMLAEYGRAAVVVLTIAHLDDPDPMNCDDGNLAALCQKCHNNYDAPMRRRHAKVTRANGAGQMFMEFLV